MSEPRTEYRFTPPQPEKHMRLTLEQYDKLLAEAKEQEREACCKDICVYCQAGNKVILSGIGSGFFYHNLPSGSVACAAKLIRLRWANAPKQRATKGQKSQ